MAAPPGAAVEGRVFYSRSHVDPGSSAFVSQLRQPQSPNLALASVGHPASPRASSLPFPAPGRGGAWGLPSRHRLALSGCCCPGWGAGLRRGAPWEQRAVCVLLRGKMRSYVCVFSPTSSLFCCEGKAQRPAPGPLEELRQMSLRKSKRLRDESPSVATSAHHGLILCVPRQPQWQLPRYGQSRQGGGLGAGKV